MPKLKFVLLTALVLCALAGSAQAAEPGVLLPPTTEASDQKRGSILIFPFYSSSASAPENEDTRIAITNTNSSLDGQVTVHFFFINGVTGAVRQSYLCFVPGQTITFRMAEFDPGIRGYIIGVAVNNVGAPVNFNFLTGEADIKLATGQRGSLQAMAVAAINLAPLSNPGSHVTLNFDGVMYNKLPRTLAMDRIPSRADGYATSLVVNRLSGLVLDSGQIQPPGTLFGILYDNTGIPFSFSLGANSPQLFGTLNDGFPRTTPRLSQIIPSGRTGWLKLYKLTENMALCGAVLNFNLNTATAARAFNGAHNLHAVTLTTASMTMVVFPPSC